MAGTTSYASASHGPYLSAGRSSWRSLPPPCTAASAACSPLSARLSFGLRGAVRSPTSFACTSSSPSAPRPLYSSRCPPLTSSSRAPRPPAVRGCASSSRRLWLSPPAVSSARPPHPELQRSSRLRSRRPVRTPAPPRRQRPLGIRHVARDVHALEWRAPPSHDGRDGTSHEGGRRPSASRSPSERLPSATPDGQRTRVVVGSSPLSQAAKQARAHLETRPHEAREYSKRRRAEIDALLTTMVAPSHPLYSAVFPDRLICAQFERQLLLTQQLPAKLAKQQELRAEMERKFGVDWQADRSAVACTICKLKWAPRPRPRP